MPRTKKDVVTEFRTAEILQAAYRVFAEQGFERATIAEIARAAGVAKGTVYLYYPSKQAVHAAALHRSAAELVDRTRAAVEGATGGAGKVRAFIESTLGYFEEHRDFFRLHNSQSGRSLCRHGQHGKPIDELYQEQLKALEKLLQDAVRRRAIRPLRTDAAAVAILQITRGVVAQRLRGLSRVPLEDDVEFAFDLAWKGIAQR